MAFFDLPEPPSTFDTDDPFSVANLNLLNDPGDIGGTRAEADALAAAAQAQAAQEAALSSAELETRRTRAQGQEFLAPFGGLGVSGVEQAGFLTDPQAQFDFLQGNPLFQLALDSANTQTKNMAAARGRISAGDTLQQLSNNVLLSASPLIADQKASIGDLLNLGTGVATTQANIAIGEGTELSNLIQSGGNVAASGTLAQQQIQQQASENRNQLAGQVFSFVASDPRLKDNKVEIGEKNGFTLWAWNWNEKAKEVFGLVGQAAGVMADEVQDKRPDAVLIQNGYMTVNYGMIGI